MEDVWIRSALVLRTLEIQPTTSQNFFENEKGLLLSFFYTKSIYRAGGRQLSHHSVAAVRGFFFTVAIFENIASVK